MQTPNHKIQLTLLPFILATDSGVVVCSGVVVVMWELGEVGRKKGHSPQQPKSTQAWVIRLQVGARGWMLGDQM